MTLSHVTPQLGQQFFSAGGQTVFIFGSFLGPAYGQLVLYGGRVHGYSNPREHSYRFTATDQQVIEFLDVAGQVTSRLTYQGGGLYVGSAVDSPGQLYLKSLLSIEPKPSGRTSRVLVNTAPKSGTYWLRKALVLSGFAPTDLHVTGRHGLHDNRGMPETQSIHEDPAPRLVEVDVDLLPLVLPAGSVTVGHIEEAETLNRLWTEDVTVINVSRDFVSILVSLFEFKKQVVKPLPGEFWRQAPTTREQFLGFAAWYGRSDIAHIRRCLDAIEACPEIPHLRYEDLRRSYIPPAGRRILQRRLGKDALGAFAAAVDESRDTQTPTRTAKTSEPEVRQWATELAVSLGYR